jgi:hypothetical protein
MGDPVQPNSHTYEDTPPQNVLISLGKMISAFNLLETVFKEALLTMLVSINRDVAVAVSRERRTFRPLIEIVQQLFAIHVKDEAKRDSFKNLCKRAQSLNDQRNTLLHSFWVVDGHNSEGHNAQRWKDDGKKTGRDAWVDVSSADLETLTRSIWVTGREVEIWMDRVVEPLIDIEIKKLPDGEHHDKPET